MNTKVVIIEDESHAAEKLARSLENIDNNIEILAKIESVEEAIAWLSTNKADLIFLDIHLGDALSFDIFQKLEIKTPIIFTTAYDQYAIQAFKLNSIDYLLKPIKTSELEAALQKFRENQLNQQSFSYHELIDALKSDESPSYQKRFMIYSGDRIKAIPVEDVAYFFAEGKYCYLIAREDKEYLVDFTLDRLEKVLDPEQFFRINRQFIISLDAIHEMFSYPKSRVKIMLQPKNKKDAIVSIERSSEFKKWLNR
ncbi:LytTR family DNA-binding domain-containing protein [Fulvivirgaceae bacterium BMA10]|uniref:LytTR family DNA-binding domain-containing protein n=1 Tax=Splendidivirga corallicola TaxID=3051826 RepID=A0ABT8KGE7_9BACT|nr:LytTR family DNA-binding domain-containing protein [Fulvivirgaceae bacterium BMA10]